MEALLAHSDGDNVVVTRSRLRAWWYRDVLGHALIRKTITPQQNLLGLVSYREQWTIRKSK